MADRRATYEELDRQLMASSIHMGLSPTMNDRDDRSRSRSLSRERERRRDSRRRSISHSPSRKYESSSRSSRRSYRSRSPRERDGRRNHGSSRRTRSRSPGSSRRRHMGNRDDPEASRCLGVFGLSLRTTERDLRDVFSRYGPIDDCQVVIDAQTGRSRGFAFIYFESVEDAQQAKESCNGIEIDGRRIRVDFSITQRPHTPTPGVYMGKPSQRDGKGYGRRRRDDYRRGGDGYRRERPRSPVPYYKRHSRRSRSRSYSPHVKIKMK